MLERHILLVTFPAQGHINPSLQFSKKLVKMDVNVTFLTTVSVVRRMAKNTATPAGLTFASFSDGYDDGWKASTDDTEHYMSEFKTRGSQAVEELITTRAKEGHPFTHVVYCPLIPWVAHVARRLHVPFTLLWNQPATILDIYYYFFNDYGDIIKNSGIDPSSTIELPGLPLLTCRDLPSFLIPSNSNVYKISLPLFKEHIDILDEEIQTKPRILVNTFDSLEAEALNSIEKFKWMPIGPLIPSAFLDGKDPSDTSFGGDLFQKSRDYVEWLDSKPESSVVYLSFGSISVLSKQQLEEIGIGLIQSNHPFLWVIRAGENGEKLEENLSCIEELEQKGMVVPWCSQVEVLSHPSLGCFVSHCGWNSSLESLASGVPVVALPQWTDQATNAKLIKDVWETGVRVTANEEGIVEANEIARCLELVMGNGERGEVMRKNAKKWRELAREAVKEGGSSDVNLKTFVDEIGDYC